MTALIVTALIVAALIVAALIVAALIVTALIVAALIGACPNLGLSGMRSQQSWHQRPDYQTEIIRQQT